MTIKNKWFVFEIIFPKWRKFPIFWSWKPNFIKIKPNEEFYLTGDEEIPHFDELWYSLHWLWFWIALRLK